MFQGCKRVAYCSESCQMRAWKLHQLQCQKPKEKNKKAKKSKKAAEQE